MMNVWWWCGVVVMVGLDGAMVVRWWMVWVGDCSGGLFSRARACLPVYFCVAEN
jgi:hypothetical protein